MRHFDGNNIMGSPGWLDSCDGFDQVFFDHYGRVVDLRADMTLGLMHAQQAGQAQAEAIIEQYRKYDETLRPKR